MKLSLPFRRAKTSRLEIVRQSLTAQDKKERNFIERVNNVPLHKFGDYNSYIKAGCSKVWASFRACHLSANLVLGATYKFVTKDKNGEDGSDITQPEITRFLTSPNPYDSWEEVLYMIVFHLKLTGNAYLLKDEINMLGQPLHLYPLLPQFVIPVPDPKEKVSKYLYRVNGRTLTFLPKEIIHIKRPHPSDLIFGMGDVEPSEALYNDYINRKVLEEKFIENGASPSGVMSRDISDSEDMDETEWGRLKTLWREEYEGKENSGKTLFISGKWTFSRLGLTHQEMQSIEKDKLGIEQIFMNHGVPLSIAGVRESANYATARVEEMNFRKYEVVPLINLIVAKLNGEGQFVKTFNPKWSLTYNLAGLIDVEQVWKDYGQLFLFGGMTPNEMRKQMGLEVSDDPMLDIVYMPQGRVPIEMAGMVPEPGAGFGPDGEPLEEEPLDDDGNPIPPPKKEEDEPPPRANGNKPPKPKKPPVPAGGR